MGDCCVINYSQGSGFQSEHQVQIQTRINGREWKGKDGVTKWFTSINGYKITKENTQSGDDPSSSFDTFDEYADDFEEDVF